MKLLELEIQNVRGIREVSLKPNGKNFVIWGSNGSGKSAVVDAVDFLLTGRISRLTGKGTGGITLGKHGPHIDCAPEEAIVRAVLKVPDVKDVIEITRCVADPNTLVCDEKFIPHLEPILTLARRGQHVLTRREILRYITAEGSTRAQDIQQLLNIAEIENIRKTFVSVQNTYDRDYKAKQRNVNTAKGAVNATVQQTSYQAEIVLQIVNQNRMIFNGSPIEELKSTALKMGLKLPSVISDDRPVNVSLFEKDVTNLLSVVLEQRQEKNAEHDSQLRSLLSTIRSDPKLLRALSRRQLIQLGIDLLDETGDCPLCEISWSPEKLREHLANRLSLADVAEQYQKQVTKLSDTILGSVNATIASLNRIIAIAQLVNIQDVLPLLQSWHGNLVSLRRALDDSQEKYPDPNFNSEHVQRLLAPNNISDILNRMSSTVVAKYPKATPEQTAWDTLTRLEENLKAVEKAEEELSETELSYRRAITLSDSFQQARDSVLGKLYEDIKDRFVTLYRQLHEEDEQNFEAVLEPDGAAINFDVDFYGRGIHPPHALHSEGHQDSMGLCLYLALAEQLTEGIIDLVILDDVVMSVDTNHRREFCRLLTTVFPNRQFLITTHDKTWTSQLRSEGVVNSKGIIEFYNWKIDTGPQVNFEVDMWERIENDIANSEIPNASARLRRGSEQFFGMVCDALQAPVKYKLNGRWELGDFLPASMGQFRRLIKKAKKAAQSWGDKELFDEFQELDSTVQQIYVRSSAEQWAVNANVHYNNWANFEEKDFRPVTEAFQDLYALFVCNKCGSVLHLATIGMTPSNVRCACGKVNWNLTEKKK